MPGPSTRAVHGGEHTDPRTGMVGTPIHQAATFRYPELEDGSKAPYIYSRYTNPSVEAVEAKIAGLDGAAGSLLFSSGMAAITTLCTAVLRPGDTVAVQRGVYGGTRAFMDHELAQWDVGIQTLDAVAAPRLGKGTKMVWVESITNPLLRVADLRAWADAARDVGALLCVDATFASPILQQPLAWGADIVMQSATKYLGGHSDLLGGALSWRDSVNPAALQQARRNMGPTMDAHTAFLLGRGMKTLDVRVRRQCENALELAQRAAALRNVAVHYPGLPSHPDHEVAKRLLSGGFGGVLTLDLGTFERARSFRRRLKTIVPAASLGGVESLASLPLETSHQYATAESRRADGITDGLVRISVGIEDVDDLWADIQKALS